MRFRVAALSPIFAAASLLALAACSDSTSPSASKTSPDLTTMQLGEVRALTFDQAKNGLTISASMADANYLVVLSNVSAQLGTNVQYAVNGQAVPGTAPTPTTAAIPTAALGPSVSRMVGGPTLKSPGAYGAAFEGHLRQMERTRFTPARLRAARSLQVPTQPAYAIVPAINDQISLKVIKSTVDPDLVCSDYDTSVGTVKALTDHAIVVSDNASPANGFTTQDFQAIANEFENVTYHTDSSYFGAPGTAGPYGARTILYYTPAVNRMTPAGTAQSQGYVGGFFFAGDLVPSQCAAGNNGMNILYLLAPDPSATYGNTFTTANVRQGTRGTVAHEFQHLINTGHRVALDTDFESTWLDEAMAHFAEDAVGRVVAHVGDLQMLTPSFFTGPTQQIDDTTFQAFFAQNLARLRLYLTRPDTSAPIMDSDHADQLTSRGASWSLVRYAADWFSNSDPRSLTRKLAAGTDTGVTNLTKATGVPLDTLLSRWLVTLFVDHQAVTGLDPKYGYLSYALRDVVSAFQLSATDTIPYPLPYGSIGDGTQTLTANFPPTSGAYYVVKLTTGGARTVKILTSSRSTVSTDPNGRVYVVRLK